MEMTTKNSVLYNNNYFHKIFKKISEKKSRNEVITTEIDWINSQIINDNRNICINACNVLIKFGKRHDSGFAINTLVSSYSRIKNDNFDIISDAVFNLLLENVKESACQFGIVNKPHPALIFINETNTAKMIYLSKKIEDIISSPERSCVNFLRPILLMILCNNETIYAESKSIWMSVMDNGNENLIRDIIALRRVTSPVSCMLYNSMIISKFIKTKNIENLLLLLSSTKYIVESSLDPSTNIDILVENHDIIISNPNCINMILFLIAEILQNCSATFIPKLLKLLNILLIQVKVGHPMFLYMILDGLIQILAYPILSGSEIAKVEELVNYIRCGEISKHFSGVTRKFSSSFLPDFNLVNAYDACIFIEENNPCKLKRIKMNYERMYWTRNQLILRGYLHSNKLKNEDYENWNNALMNLIEVSKTDDVLKSSLVMPLLFELSQSFNPKIKVSILQNITDLGASTEIFCTIKALSAGMIRSMSITLHLKLWKKEPRIYPFLHKCLVEKSIHDSEDFNLNIVRADTIKQICDLKPHHGSDLVTIISEILNQSLESKTEEVAASLAIDSISFLCLNHIISITSTWKAISLTTRYEKRPRVIKSLCNFFSTVPQFKRNNLEYETFMKDIVSRIFYMIQRSDVHGINCALNAFKSWTYDTLTLDMIPDTYRENISLPEAPTGMEVSMLDLEVPGECYVQLLSKINPHCLHSVGDLISHFIRQEISEYRSGHYLVKEGHAEPINYKTLPKQSIVKALTHFVIQQAMTKKVDKLVDETILIEALNILSQKYSRPLPPLNWTFLHELVHKGKAIRAKCMAVASKQAIISGTAKRLIENFLINIDESSHEDIEIALDILVDLCNGVSNEILKLFLDKIFTCHSDKLDEEILKLLSHEKHVTNRENLTMIISTFINRVTSPSNNIVRLIPSNILNAIPIMSENKIKYRCEILKENVNVENSVAWLNELLLEQYAKNEFRDILSTSFIELLTSTKSFPTKKWLNEFIIVIQNKMIEKDTDIEGLKYLLDMMLTAVVCMSGYFIADANCNIFKNRYALFPQSLWLYCSQDKNSDITPSLFEFFVYSMNQQSSISKEIRSVFKSAIVLCKNHCYFKKSKAWHNFLQVSCNAMN
ncbi:unnamed protein product [Chironomus riparius]|uniref:DUF3730 domain-containing protein n=1 Tax=Chironomus riparius TaxID=315576 RepID=A0A9N9WKW3_9DIPT|nr:unnamed protein product [Chironomus riparius]